MEEENEENEYWFEVYAFALDAQHGDAPFFVFRSKYREEAVARMIRLPIQTRSHIVRVKQCHRLVFELIPYNK